ncbi:hypothetical protein KC318_g222 [Hortaea werneckii]|nr:hypothetical protein KC318_g222 [Hortaea werneckii]
MATSNSRLQAAILIVSETASKDPSTDKGIPALQDVFAQKGGDKWTCSQTKIVPDSVLDIQKSISEWTDGEEAVNLVLTSGGTGFTQKDNTPEVIAMMARPIAGVRNKTLIITLPGSPKGARENLEAILPQLAHACEQAAGADSRALHAGGTKRLEKEAGLQDTSVHGHHHHSHDHSHSNNHSHGHGHHHGPKAHTKPEDRPPISNDPNAGPTRRYRESPYPMLTVEEALQQIGELTPEPTVVKAPVDENLVGSVLAEDVTATESVPAFRASIVDGYAIIASKHIMVPSTKGIFPVVGVSHAKPGQMSDLRIGEVARITTGAPLPPGATSVVMVEDTVLKSMTEDGQEEKEIEILTDAIEPGENVREVGSDVKTGEVIMEKGEGITTVGGEFGLLASVGAVRLYNITDPENFNWERPGALEQTLRDAMRTVDVIITSGGVSMGELDLLKPTIERSLGGTIHFGRVSMKPGKPTTFATVPFKSNDGLRARLRVIFSLPGNPASAVVTYHLFVLPALHKMAGVQPVGLPKVQVVLEQDVKCDSKRAEYHRVMVVAKSDGLLHAVSTGFQRSSRIGSFKGANALLCLPVKEGKVVKGERIDALLMGKIVSEV